MSIYYKWYHKIFGKYDIKTNGKNAGEVLSYLNKNNIPFFNSRFEDGNLFISSDLFSVKRITDYLEDYEIINRTGIPFTIERYRKRYGILVGLILGFLIIFMSSLYVWDVRIETDNGVDREKVYELLRNYGLDMGTFMPKFDVRKAESSFLKDNTEYSFLAINLKGTVASISIRKAEKKPEIMDTKGIYNVVANKKGIIYRVKALNGSISVSPGDSVDKGDILISAFMEGRLGLKRGVHAKGEVEAVVYYDYEKEIPLITNVKEYTGAKETKTKYSLLNMSLKLFSNDKSPYEFSDAEGSLKKTYLFGIQLPFTTEKITYSEYKLTEMTISKEKGINSVKSGFEAWKTAEIKGQILSETVNTYFNESKNTVTIKATLSVLEDIGTEVKIY